jgi:metallo-beta-lactamase family protein
VYLTTSLRKVEFMAKLSFHGAAGEVTGSCYLLETPRARILIDYGMFQGGRDTRRRNAQLPPIRPAELDAVVLTHAHLDHCGRLPLLVHQGYRGPIFATPATISLAGIILRDSAAIQEMDATQESRRRARQGRPPVSPLYTSKDAAAVLRLFEPVRYEEHREIAPGIEIRLVDAGHILGSASVQMTVKDRASDKEKPRTVVFSGDIGVKGSPLLRDPTPLEHADLLVLESTYGDRDHRQRTQTIEELITIIEEAQAEDGKILIPAFAVGRTQDVTYHLGQALRGGRPKSLNVYLDSPMAIETSELYKRHRRLFDEEAGELWRTGRPPLEFPGFQYARTPQQSQRLNTIRGGMIVIAGAGMCTGGRIVHHLRHGLWQPSTHVVFVGYQAQGTLGRELVDGAERVRIFGESIAVKASVHTLGGFSAHAGQTGLVEWASPLKKSAPKVFLTHGEDQQRQGLSRALRRHLGLRSTLPSLGQTITF